MPASTDAPARVTRAGEALRFAGVLSRATVPGVWKALPDLAGVRKLDLGDVTAVDSAGLALLSVLSGRCGGVAIEGDAPGLAELQSAYRLDPGLGF